MSGFLLWLLNSNDLLLRLFLLLLLLLLFLVVVAAAAAAAAVVVNCCYCSAVAAVVFIVVVCTIRDKATRKLHHLYLLVTNSCNQHILFYFLAEYMQHLKHNQYSIAKRHWSWS